MTCDGTEPQNIKVEVLKLSKKPEVLIQVHAMYGHPPEDHNHYLYLIGCGGFDD